MLQPVPPSTLCPAPAAADQRKLEEMIAAALEKNEKA